MKSEACFWIPSDKKLQCQLCAHACMISEGKTGFCGVRKNENKRLYSLIYSSCTSVSADPIEKKPLFHFYPGTSVLSFGSIGCNFRCPYCQNFTISSAGADDRSLQDITPEDAVAMAKTDNCKGIAWTYNEPTIWYEYTLDTAKQAKKEGLYTVYVTNGYIKEDPLKEISPYLDAMNIDVKAFDEKFYKKICQAKLEPVLQTCIIAKKLGIHIELTYLVIPGYNDSLEEINKFCKWVVDALGVDIPVHFSRFHPDYKMTDAPVTPVDSLIRIYKEAKDAGLQYPYLGNVPHGSYENTICPSCGAICIERHGYTIKLTGFKEGKCIHCGTNIPLIFDSKEQKR
ncbi:MAG: AmmeMemoRadiSam system radical SAM enzyme [Euryarchaeota archaeon]|nr:AmmeMemoRadiSam system radical SAM enzyme [Euryarchaeota archaeon]